MYKVSAVHSNEYVIGETDKKMICTDEKLYHIDRESGKPHTETIPISEITRIRREADESLAGFERIGCVFASFALVFTVMSVPFLLAEIFDTIAGGLYVSTILSWFGFVTFYKMDHGTLDVLEIWTHDKQYLFFMKKEDTAFDEIATHLERSAPEIEQANF